jgi:hypothetical protein
MGDFPADFRGPAFAYNICHYGAMFEMLFFPRFRTPRATKNVLAALDARVWVRDPAARYARVVNRFAPFEIRGRRESRVPAAPAASRAK